MKKNMVKIAGFCLVVVALSAVCVIGVVKNGVPAKKMMVIESPITPLGNINTEESKTAQVYWDDSDQYYHSDKDCPELADEKVYSGTVEEAESEGKISECEICFK